MIRAGHVCRTGAILVATLMSHGCLYPDYRVDSRQGSAGGTSGGVSGASGSGNASGASFGGAHHGGAGAGGSGGVGGAEPDGGGSLDAAAGGPGGDASTAGQCLGDCLDPSCRTDSICGGTCAPAATLECGTVLTPQSTDGPGSTERLAPPAYSCYAEDLPGPEMAYRFTGDPGQRVFISAHGLTDEAALFLVNVVEGSDCRANFACAVASDHPGTEPEVVTFMAAAGRDYFAIVDGPAPVSYSIAVACSSPGGCIAARGIEAGQTITSSNEPSLTNVTQAVGLYSCHQSDHSGPEAAFLFIPTAAGDYQAQLTNLSGNVNLFIIKDECGPTCLTETSRSVHASTQDESVTFTADAHVPYYIVVDSFTTSVVTFTLSLTAL
jgi:hypothetical protein